MAAWSFRKWVFLAVGGLLLICLLLAVLSALNNRNLPAISSPVDQISSSQKARIQEFFQVRQTLGNQVWPEWGSAEIPIVQYNEKYSFLIGINNPITGWQKISQENPQPGNWQQVPGDGFGNVPYYRQLLPVDGTTPEAFTVQIGDQWAASMPTMEWMEITMTEQFRDAAPSFLEPILPYSMMNDLLLRGSEGYITLLAHESFHAYQGMINPQKLIKAEENVAQLQEQYPWMDGAFIETWQEELSSLTDALKADTPQNRVHYTRQFLDHREKRRQAASLSKELVDYEKSREWLEGLARYVELELWRQASLSVDYEPLSDLDSDPDFSGYMSTFPRRWSQEIDQINRMADDQGDGRFYYSGMAQAFLLDELMPDWKEKVMLDEVFLEDLLKTAVSNSST